jgi:hypothetical protein
MKRVDRPTRVEVVFDEGGRPQVRMFAWNGKMLPVISLGRTWLDEVGRHVLVMAAGERVFELLLRRSDLCWRVVGRLPGRYLV